MSCRKFQCKYKRGSDNCKELSARRCECEKCVQFLCMNCKSYEGCVLQDGVERFASVNSGAYENPKSAVYYHAEICDGLKSLYARKNKDYGDSFARARKEIPFYTLGKLYDKFSRIKTLMISEEEHAVPDETIEDTLRDLANYAIMELAERKAEKK